MGGANSGRKPDAGLRYRRAKAAGIKFPAAEFSAPNDLDKRALKHWSHAVEMLRSVPGMLTQADEPLLEQYARAWEEFYQANDDIRASGLTAISDKGAPYQNPAVGIRHRAQAAVIAIAKLLRFDPKGRGAGNGETETKDEPVNPLAEMMSRRGSVSRN